MHLTLDDDRKKSICDTAYKEILMIHQDRREEEDRMYSYRNQYYGVVAEKTTPYVGSFNLNVPITPKIVDAAAAQAEEVFEDIDPKWRVTPSVRKDMIDVRDLQEKTLDYYSDTEMKDAEAWGKAYHDAFLLGIGWLGMPYRRRFERVKGFRVYNNIDKFKSDFPNDWEKYPTIVRRLKSRQPQRIIAEFNQEVKRGPSPEHYEWEDIYVPLHTKGLEGMCTAKIIARRVMMRWVDIYKEEKEGDFFPGVADAVKFQVEDGKVHTDPHFSTKEYETFECIYFHDIDDDNKEERLLLRFILPETTVDANELGSRVVPASIIKYPYFHNRPFIIPVYIKTDRPGIYQDGFGALLQDIHVAANATLNHILDASVIANSLSLKARRGSDAARRVYEHRWYPGSVLELSSMDDVQQFTFNTPNLSSLVTLFTIIERFAGDATGIVNYLLGQESPDDPEAPFRKQRALTRKAEIKLRKYIKNIKRPLNEAGYQALRLIYQFTPAKRLTEITGQEVGEAKDFMSPAMRTRTQASGFESDRLNAKFDGAKMLELLQSEPEFMSNPAARVKGWYILAKDWGSQWGDKIKDVLPTPEQVAEREKKRAEAEQKNRLGVGQKAAQKVLEAGGNPEDAKIAGQKAIKTFDEMKKREAAAVQEEAKKGKK